MALLEAEDFRPQDNSAGPDNDNDVPADPLVASALFFPILVEWRRVLHRLGIGAAQAAALAARATREGTAFQSELARFVDENELVAALAADAHLQTLDRIDPARVAVTPDEALRWLRERPDATLARYETAGDSLILIAPERLDPHRLHDMRKLARGVVERLCLVSPTLLRRAFLEHARPLLVAAADGLSKRMPHCSARAILDNRQKRLAVATLLGLAAAAVLWPQATLDGLHAVFSVLFLCCVALRIAAIADGRGSRPQRSPLHVGTADTVSKPRYSVLVALRREAEVVPGLLASLDRLVWPRDRLDIKLICEADDPETLEALRRTPLPAHVDVVEVPPMEPRTKPKALAFALPLARGEFVVLYDAEDDPHPLQLVEAWERFRQSGEDLACVQAPLDIVNGRESMIARMFQFEYAALFHGMLPYLAAGGRLVPLGGTSNHFRRRALDEVGGWDPHNVTEDADLGLRLARFGYRTEMIGLPTFEPAPTEFRVWLRQRTRWFTGWAVTWLVHMRRPSHLLRELGPASFAIAQILFAGMLASALVHPLLVMSVVWFAVDRLHHEPLATWHSAWLAVDFANVAAGYAAFLMLGRRGLPKAARYGFWRIVLWTPVYWMMLSVAAFSSMHKLWRKPHHWAKTPHRAWQTDAARKP